MTHPYLERPVRTVWQAARDLFDEAFRDTDPDKWQRAYALWCYACAVQAPGEQFTLNDYVCRWLPTCCSSPTFGAEPPGACVCSLPA